MHIGIDAREIRNGVYTGIGRALIHFLRYFDSADHQDQCVLFSDKPLPFKFGSRITHVLIPESVTLWWDQVLLPMAVNAAYLDLFFSPYYKIPLAAHCCKVSAVLDVMYLTYPPYASRHSWIQKLYYSVMGKVYAHGVDRIFTSSLYSKKDIIAVYAVDPLRIEVIPLGVSDGFVPLIRKSEAAELKSALGISERYLLYVGNFKPHKNVSVLLRAFSFICPLMPDLSLVLVAPKQGSEPLLRLAKELRIEERVILTGAISDESKLRLLYGGAEVFVLPSLYEGFGIPPVEAMACGIPVVCADATCLPETCAGAAVMVEPESVEAYREALMRLLTDEEYREALRVKGLDRVLSIREYDFGRRLHDLFRRIAGHA